MMWGYTYGNACNGFAPWGIVGSLVNVLLIVIFVAIIIKIFRRHNGVSGLKNNSWWNSAENLLKERFVKGEISKEEYEEKLKVIRNS